MKYLTHLLLEENVKGLVIEKENVIDNININKIVFEINDYVKSNIGMFVDLDGDINQTYENISNFSEQLLIGILEDNVSILNDITTSDYLKDRLINEAFERTKWVGGKVKSGASSLWSKRGSIKTAIGTGYQHGTPGTAPTIRHRGHAPGTTATYPQGLPPTVGSPGISAADPIQGTGIRGKVQRLWHGSNIPQNNNPSPGLKTAYSNLKRQWHGGKLNNSDSTQGVKFGRTKVATKVGIPLIAWLYFKNAVDFGFERTRLQDFNKDVITNPILDSIDKYGLSTWIPFFDHDDDKTIGLLKKYNSILKDYSSKIDDRLDNINAENRFELDMYSSDMKKAIEELNDIWPNLDQAYTGGKEDLIKRTNILMSKIDDGIAEFEKIPEMGPVAKFFIENSGVLSISLIIPALLYMGYINNKEYVRIKMFDYKLNKYIENLSRLGQSDIIDLKGKILVQRNQCESNIKREDNKIKVKEPVRCYINYASAILILIIGALYNSSQNNGIDLKRIQTVEQLLSNNDGRKDKGINEIAKKAFTDYKEFIEVIFNDKSVTSKIINDLNSKFKQILKK
jgi:hypothetical protein